MANALYDLGRQKFLSGNATGGTTVGTSIIWLTDNIKAALVDSAVYTPDLTADEFLSDVTSGGAVIATSSNLSSKDATDGVADAADITFSSVSGAQSEYIVIYKDTGTASTSPLIALIDTATGIPVTPSGADITVAWDGGANKIFKL